MDGQFYTTADIAEMKFTLTKACIDLAIKDAVLESGPNRCLHGSPSSGYWYALDHSRTDPHQPDLVPEDLRPAMVHYRLPPVTRNPASFEPAVLENYLGDPVRSFDPWGAYDGSGFHPQGLYASWVDAVEHAFEKPGGTRHRSRLALVNTTSSY